MWTTYRHTDWDSLLHRNILVYINCSNSWWQFPTTQYMVYKFIPSDYLPPSHIPPRPRVSGVSTLKPERGFSRKTAEHLPVFAEIRRIVSTPRLPDPWQRHTHPDRGMILGEGSEGEKGEEEVWIKGGASCTRLRLKEEWKKGMKAAERRGSVKSASLSPIIFYSGVSFVSFKLINQ